MPSLTGKSFDTPDERRSPPKATIDIVDMDGTKAARLVFEPGWKWSECIKPIAGTESCMNRHVGAIISGQLHVVHDDGSEADVGAGGAYVIEPGHDAWVVGDVACVALEFESTSADSYAKPT